MKTKFMYSTDYCNTKNDCKYSIGKWVEISDDDVRSVWVCSADCVEKGKAKKFDPDDIVEFGHPICQFCEEEMGYVRTEVKI